MSAWTRLLTRLRGRRPRCEWARIQTPRLGDRHLYIERCLLDHGHPGDHAAIPEPVLPEGAATELTQHDQEHGIYEEDR